MADKQQARGGLETIDIKGKAYVTVAERIKAVTDIENLEANRYEIESWERFELDGRHFLTCHIRIGNPPVAALPEEQQESDYRKRYSGTSQISFTGGMVNTTSGYENAETSALGRALAFAGIGLLEGVASADEIHKARAAAPEAPQKPELLDPSKMKTLRSLMASTGHTGDKATDLCQFIINKEAPTNNAEVDQLISALEGK